MSDEKNRLVEGILDEARTKAGKIIKEAEDEARLIAEEGFEEAMKQVESEKRSFRLREHQIALREESAKRSIDRLSELKNMDTAYQLVSEEVERKIAKLAESGENPKGSGCAHHAEGGDRECGKLLQGGFADRSHQSPHHVCGKRKEVPFDVFIVAHLR